MSLFRIAVISDLHAFSAERNPAPSYLEVPTTDHRTEPDVIADLLNLIQEYKIEADLLVCPGDLGDRADSAGISYAWMVLGKLKKALRAKRLAATAGNHDLASHSDVSGDPLAALKRLKPPYPLGTKNHSLYYWSEEVVQEAGPVCRLVVLNSSASHVYSKKDLDNGRVSDLAMSRLRDIVLTDAVTRKVNVLLCHHHPQQHQEIKLGDYDVMKDGQLLLELLGSGNVGRWMVIHGHKHHPKISYAAGSSTSPVILSSGSLSAVLYPELTTRARNQFHMVTFELDYFESLGFVGTVDSWDWGFGAGWVPAGDRSGLPRHTGFGIRTDPSLLARQLALHCGASKRVDWKSLTDLIPEIRFVLPGDMVSVRRVLASEYGLNIEFQDGLPVQVAKKL